MAASAPTRRPAGRVRTAAGRALSLMVLSLAVAGTLTGCDGDDPAGGMMDPGADLDPTFTPDDPSPEPMTVSLASAGAVDESLFVSVLVSELADVYGLAFRVTYDPAVLEFAGFSSGGSFLATGGPGDSFFFADTQIEDVCEDDGTCSNTMQQCDADEDCEPPGPNPGTVFATATRLGAVEGVDAGASQVLMTLTFRAIDTTDGSSPLAFAGDPTRVVLACPAPAPDGCTEVDPMELTWSGGSVVVVGDE